MYGLQAPNDYNLKSTLFSHKLYTKQKKLFLVPNKFDNTTINPENFLKLKGKIKIKETLLIDKTIPEDKSCLLYTSPSPRDKRQSRMPSSA